MMHETLPCYLVLQVVAKLAKRRALGAISCIGYILLYDWPSNLREQIKRTFQFRNCHGKFFCSFLCIHGNNPRVVSVYWKRLHTKTSLPVGKCYLPIGKRVSVTTTIVEYGCREFLRICRAVKPNFHEKAYQRGPENRDAVKNVNPKNGKSRCC